MKKEETHYITPVQPYLAIEMEDYKRVITENTGISHFYEFKVEAGEEPELQAVPDGSVDLLFGIGTKDVRTYISGTVLKVKKWPLDAGRDYFGVRFQPGKYILPDDLSIEDIINNDLELNDGFFGKKLGERIAEGRNIYERAHIFMGAYMERKMENKEKKDSFRLERYIRKRIYETKGSIGIKELAEETGYSECYIRRTFSNVHGISPKVFEKFVRFQNTLNNLNHENVKLDEVALECGYYDQPHMIRDFKVFSGVTPEAYINLISDKREKIEM